MIAPTPGSPASGTTPAEKLPVEAAPDAMRPLPSESTATGAQLTPDWSSPEGRARDMLERLGRADHPDAEQDPIHALYQVAVDYRCSAHGYRELYLHHMRHARD